MRRKQTFALVWVGLFFVTIGIRHITANGSADAASVPSEAELREILSDIDKQPEATDAASVPAFDIAVSDYIRSGHNRELHECKASALANSTRPKEYFEFSFRIGASLQSAVLGRSVRLDHMKLERASTEVSAEALKCLSDKFAKFEVIITDALPDRVRYRMCFSR